jgi:hypothetical protein
LEAVKSASKPPLRSEFRCSSSLINLMTILSLSSPHSRRRLFHGFCPCISVD